MIRLFVLKSDQVLIDLIILMTLVYAYSRVTDVFILMTLVYAYSRVTDVFILMTLVYAYSRVTDVFIFVTLTHYKFCVMVYVLLYYYVLQFI